MKSMKMRGIAAAVTGALLFGFGANAMADSSVDIVNALVAKGVLTEEEGALITKGAKEEKAANAKAIKKADRLTISNAIDNATIYGDIRARYERRNQDLASNGVNYDTNRSRYKITLGVETKAGDWYSDLAVAMGKGGRSDNVTFGDGYVGADPGMSTKDSQVLYVKRAMIGWKPTDWLAVEAGRTKNPLYMVNAMVFDHDIVMEGANEKLNYKFGDTNLFANLGQWIYTGSGVSGNDTQSTTSRQNMVLAFQAGAQQAFNDKFSAKGAIGYYDYTANGMNAKGVQQVAFVPYVGNTNVTSATVAAAGVNDLAILDVLGELNYMATPSIGVRPYAEYAYNTLGSDRYNSAIAATAAGAARTALQAAGKDDNAWLVGITIGSAKDLKSFEGKKVAKGDWSANLWYQSVGTYALDPNAIDSDIFDGKLNMEGTSLKAQYNIEDNVALNFTGAWGDRKNNAYGTTYSKADLSLNGTKYELFQFDVTYKF